MSWFVTQRASHSRAPADGRDHQRFDQHDGQHEPLGEANRLEHRQLARALTHGDGHRVAGHEQQREEHDAADRQQQELDVPHLLDEAAANADSVCVRVSDAELLNSSMADATAWACAGFATRTM